MERLRLAERKLWANSRQGGRSRIADTRIFSPLAVPGLCVTIGRYVYLFERLTLIFGA